MEEWVDTDNKVETAQIKTIRNAEICNIDFEENDLYKTKGELFVLSVRKYWFQLF